MVDSLQRFSKIEWVPASVGIWIGAMLNALAHNGDRVGGAGVARGNDSIGNGSIHGVCMGLELW